MYVFFYMYAKQINEHNYNCQIILKLFAYDIFCNDLWHKKESVNLEVSEVSITHYTNRGFKARMMLHIGAGQSNNSPIVPKLFGYDIFCNSLQHKKYKQIWRYQMY